MAHVFTTKWWHNPAQSRRALRGAPWGHGQNKEEHPEGVREDQCHPALPHDATRLLHLMGPCDRGDTVFCETPVGQGREGTVICIA